MKDYHAGDICTYPHGAGNRSFAVVEPVRILNDPVERRRFGSWRCLWTIQGTARSPICTRLERL